MLHEWPEEQTRVLKELWAQGLSAELIVAKIGGVTRSAVLGKVRRLKLKHRQTVKKAREAKPKENEPKRPRGRPPKPKPPKAERPKRPIKPPKAVKAKPPAALIIFDAPESQEISLEELKGTTCHWPNGDPLEPDFSFCGQPTEDPKRPYCPYHLQLAYVPGSAWECRPRRYRNINR